MANLPEAVKVGGFNLLIKGFTPLESKSKQLRGELSWHQQSITLDMNEHPALLAETLIHEVLHAIYRAYDLQGEDDEERTTTTLGLGIVQVVRDNPVLIKAIDSLLKEPKNG